MNERSSILSPSALWRGMGLAHHNWPGRFSVLLVTILILLVTQPMFSGHVYAQTIVTASISLMLLSALYIFRETKTFFIIALTLIIPALGCRVALQFTANPTLEIIGGLSSCLFLSVTVIALVSRLFSVKSVTLDTISAAICAYLLMAIAWAYAFAVVELRHPGSFSATLFQRTPGSNSAPLLSSLHSFIYYSFICLTTTGFGDIAPVSDGARTLSVLESVVGQLYMAVLIARLVSLEVAQSMTKAGGE